MCSRSFKLPQWVYRVAPFLFPELTHVSFCTSWVVADNSGISDPSKDWCHPPIKVDSFKARHRLENHCFTIWRTIREPCLSSTNVLWWSTVLLHTITLRIKRALVVSFPDKPLGGNNKTTMSQLKAPKFSKALIHPITEFGKFGNCVLFYVLLPK